MNKTLIALCFMAALVALAACRTPPKPAHSNPPPPQSLDCDQPGRRDDTGRPIPQC